MKNLDFITYLPTIKFEKSEGIKTVFGSILTILMCMISIFSFSAFGKDLFLKKAPITRYSSEIAANLTIQNSDVFIPIGFVMRGGAPIDDIERRLEVFYGKFDVENGRPLYSYYQFFRGVQCSKHSKPFIENKQNIHSFLGGPQERYWCPPEEFRFDIEGVYGSSKVLSWDIHVRACVNTTENNNHCFPKSNNDEYLKLFFTHIVASSNLVNPSDLENPITPIFITKWARSSSHVSRQEVLFYKAVKFISDEGFILESLQNKDTFQFYNFESDVFPINNPNPLFRLVVSLASERSIINREYVKIQKVAADVGGIVKFILLISMFLNNYVSKVVFLDRYMNKAVEEKSNIFKDKLNNVVQDNYVKIKDKSSVLKDKTNTIDDKNKAKSKIKEDSFSKLAELKEETNQIKTKNFWDWIKLIRAYYCSAKKSNPYHRLNQFYTDEYSFESFIQLKSHIEFLSQSLKINFNDVLRSYNSRLLNAIQQT